MRKKATLNEKKFSLIDDSSVTEALPDKGKKTCAPKNVASPKINKQLPITNKNEEKLSRKDKPQKIKMIRFSLTLPEEDYAKLSELKKKCLETGVQVKKSELMRAGLLNLFKLNEVVLLKSVAQVEIIKKKRSIKE